MRKVIFLFLVAIAIFSCVIFDRGKNKSIIINEVMASNFNILLDEDGDSSDWIELYNYSNSPINLKGYYLSDEKRNVSKWSFSNVVIKPKDYLLVFASGKNKVTEKEIHTNFKLDKLGEILILSDPKQRKIDSVYIKSSINNISYGRCSLKQNGLSLLAIPTAGEPNQTLIIEDEHKDKELHLTFSKHGGFYKNEFELEIKANQEDITIYYTLDGSEPSLDSMQYNNPISIKANINNSRDYCYNSNISYMTYIDNSLFKPKSKIDTATVVRTLAYKKDYPIGKVVTHTYFVGKVMRTQTQLPIISLVTDKDNLFDYHDGIYVTGQIYDEFMKDNPDIKPDWFTPANYHERGRHWERPLSFEYYDSNGKLALKQDAGLRIHGGSTRSQPNKAFKIIPREKYGDKDVLSYVFFKDLVDRSDNPICDFKVIVLRASGDDWRNTLFRDAMMHQLVLDTSLDIQAYSPCIVYLNGVYWGLYNNREEVNKDYIYNHYGIIENEVSIIKNWLFGIPEEVEEFHELLEFVEDNDMNVIDNWNHVKSIIDIDNYLEYVCAQIFYSNTDWPGNNIKMWRKSANTVKDLYGHDGKWRFILLDTDFGFDLFGHMENNSLKMATEVDSGVEWPNPPISTVLLRNLLENEEFASSFINTMADWMNTRFAPHNVKSLVYKLATKIDKEVKKHDARWDCIYGGYDEWRKDLQALCDFPEDRSIYVKEHIMEYFDIDNITNIKISTNNPNGHVNVNSIESIKFISRAWSGDYFISIPIIISAKSCEGAEFSHWIVDGIRHDGEVLELTPYKKNIDIKAVFSG